MIVDRIDKIIEEHSLLKHPFYQMWSAGELDMDSLSGYSKEYFQLVKAVPLFMDPLIQQAPKELSDELACNRQEEYDHILLWKDFATSLGVSESQLHDYAGLPKTRRAIDSLRSLMITFEGGASAMYAFEKEIPKISQTKLEGLAEFYGLDSDGATRYFKTHMEADIRHTASWRNILESADTSEDLLAATAEMSVSAQNMLLDGCYAEYC